MINGKSYDTDTAELKMVYYNVCLSCDLNSYSELLYLTPNGTWFLYGSGGCLSRYATLNGASVEGGETIIPMTRKEAKKWAANYASDSQYFRIFYNVLPSNPWKKRTK